MKKLNNRGSVDPFAWIVALAGFCITYFVWVFSAPIVNELITAAFAMKLPDVANNILTFTKTLYEYGLIINAGMWILYLILSSFKEERDERTYTGY